MTVSQQKWLTLLILLSLLSALILGGFAFQLRETRHQLEAIHSQRLDSYDAIEEIMYFNIERANAIRGLLAYKDRRFLESYYSMSQQAEELKTSITNDPRTPSSLIDLLYRDGIWEQGATQVLVFYERGDIEAATELAETMTDQRQTILEDLRALKKMQYEDIRKQLVATENQIDTLIQALTSIAILLIATLLVLSFLIFKTRKKDRLQ
ncbi:hypothetical protein [Exiguobacterium aurantiacum]|uniref:Chemotaxis methyl-accepting receptor HlyB-like 4HB MCP domain-containing protein n=1 Tax=Exiguobacterium aurantiacum TaxID=33987 RepID=A0ABY5FTF2_9BACL|nr:hypothetical protein [Exiguobacterium aurantiacum]UTT44507.1 hypothetical protein NMQ00_12885 [Exiguobacterium aurantiacum]